MYEWRWKMQEQCEAPESYQSKNTIPSHLTHITWKDRESLFNYKIYQSYISALIILLAKVVSPYLHCQGKGALSCIADLLRRKKIVGLRRGLIISYTRSSTFQELQACTDMTNVRARAHTIINVFPCTMSLSSPTVSLKMAVPATVSKFSHRPQALTHKPHWVWNKKYACTNRNLFWVALI